MDSKNRFINAFRYLKDTGVVHTQRDLAEKMQSTEGNISKAMKGEEKVLTDKFLTRFCNAFSGTFNLEWLLYGKETMLKDHVNDRFVGYKPMACNKETMLNEHTDDSSVNNKPMEYDDKTTAYDILNRENEFKKQQLVELQNENKQKQRTIEILQQQCESQSVIITQLTQTIKLLQREIDSIKSQFSTTYTPFHVQPVNHDGNNMKDPK